MSGPERRKFSRLDISLETQIEIDGRPEWGQIVNISEHGALARLPSAPKSGARAKLLFEHPIRQRPASMEATVVRAREGGATGGADVAFRFTDGLTARAVNRRNGDRFQSTIPAELYSRFQRAAVTIVDVSASGAAVSCSAQLDPGPARIRFRHPMTRAGCTARIVVLPCTRRSNDGLYRHGARFLDSLRELARDPRCGERLPLPLASVSGAFFEEGIDLIESQELDTRGVQRRLIWQDDTGNGGPGRVVLASSDAILVASDQSPTSGQDLLLLLQRPGDGRTPAMRLTVRVEKVGAHHVAGREPGFLAEITGFPFQVDRESYRELASWLANRGTAGV